MVCVQVVTLKRCDVGRTDSTSSDAVVSRTGESTVSSLSGQFHQPAEARPFDELMDLFSLHHFMIRKGHVVVETPEFESYQRSHGQLWPQLVDLMNALSAICVQYAVPLAIINGKSLAELASGSHEPSMEQLLMCIANLPEVAGMLRQPGR